MPNCRIIRLQAENIKRIEAVDITPASDLVIVAGDNAQGKTSVLDSILYALGGKDKIPQEPIREGQHKGKVTLDCGEFIVMREFTVTGQRLILKGKDGASIDRPQSFLDNLIGSLSFDPLEFSRMKPKDRLDTLLGLTDGLEEKIAEIEDRRSKTFAERAENNVTLRNLNGQLAEMDKPCDDWPEAEVGLDTFVTKRKELQAVIDSNNRKRSELVILKDRQSRLSGEVAQLKADLKAKEDAVIGVGLLVLEQAKTVETLDDPNIGTIDTEMAATIEGNKLAIKRQSYQKTISSKIEYETRSAFLTKKIESYDKEKEKALASAKLPISGLEFSDGDVRYVGVLFDQLSGAEQLRVSLSMAMAANPSLRVIRITNGSLLDNDNIEIVRQMAGENDYQVWIECVGDRTDATVVIEDGSVLPIEELQRRRSKKETTNAKSK
jgi:hypothetical protein